MLFFVFLVLTLRNFLRNFFVYFLYGYEEALVLAGAGSLSFRMQIAVNHIRNIIVGYRCTLVIQMGIISFVVAFVLLMVYMVMMYNIIPGMMANLALLVKAMQDFEAQH